MAHKETGRKKTTRKTRGGKATADAEKPAAAAAKGGEQDAAPKPRSLFYQCDWHHRRGNGRRMPRTG